MPELLTDNELQKIINELETLVGDMQQEIKALQHTEQWFRALFEQAAQA